MAPTQQRAPAATGPAVDLVEVPADPSSLISQLATSEIRQQFEMARSYPRSITQFQNYVRQMALLDEETAASCFYALPRRDNEAGADRTIEGPSARFAEIVNSAWGHMRAEGRVVDELERFVVGRGTAWDVQQNVIIAYEVRRRIWSSPNRRYPEGRRYSDDMIGVTANAASSIALRNAVLKVVPAPLWRSIWLQCKEAAVGTVQTLSKRRKEMLDYFQKAGVRPERVLATLGAQSEADITLDMLAVLRGVATALKEGDTTLDEAFPELRPGTGPVVMPQRETPAEHGQAPAAPAQTTSAPPTTAAPPVPASGPGPIERATNSGEIGTGPYHKPTPDHQALGLHVAACRKVPREGKSPMWHVALSDGRRGTTFSTTLGDQCDRLADSKQPLKDAHFTTRAGYTYIDKIEVA